MVIIETAGDIARLTQSVYEFYTSTGAIDTLPIVALVRAKDVERNPALASWDIDGHAALLSLSRIEDSDWQSRIEYLIECLQNSPE